jgi:hypothetical protein
MAEAALKKMDVGVINSDVGIITATTPLRLEVAARLAYPDGSMTAAALRRLVVAEKVTHEFVAGKYYVTLAAIEEMRASCRVPAKPPTLPSKNIVTDEPQPGSSETDSFRVAQDAMNMIAEELKKPSPATSQRSTTQKRRLTPRMSTPSK